MRLNKTYILSFIGSNAVAALLAFVINTWVNLSFNVDFIGQYAYGLAMSSLVFTVVDFGRVNDLLLRKIFSKKSILQNILFAVAITLIGYFFNLYSFGILTLVILYSVQRYLLNYSVLIESKKLTWFYQILGALIRLMFIFILTIGLEFKNIYILMFIACASLIYFIYSDGKNLLSKTSLNIGVLNIGLIIVERFDVIILHDHISETDYASLSAILSYTFLIGIFADPIIKYIYKNSDKISVDLLDNYVRQYSLYIIIIIALFFGIGDSLLKFFFNDKFSNVSLFVAYGILFQLIRIGSQIYEITILNKNFLLILVIRGLSVSVLFLGLNMIEFIGLTGGLIIFLLARIIPIYAIRRI